MMERRSCSLVPSAANGGGIKDGGNGKKQLVISSGIIPPALNLHKNPKGPRCCRSLRTVAVNSAGAFRVTPRQTGGKIVSVNSPQLNPAVLFTSVGAMVVGNGELFTITDRPQPRAVDTLLNEIETDRIRTHL